MDIKSVLKFDEIDENALKSDATEMATEIKTFSDLLSLNSINGLSLDEINRRAAPGTSADSGFLARNQTIQQCLLDDWKVVRSLGMTHIELSQALHTIIYTRDNGEESLTVNPVDLLPTIAKRSLVQLKPQNLIFQHNTTEGYQESLFHNSDIPHSPENKVTITNSSFACIGLEISAAYGPSSSQADWIKRYGFYEGGDSNAYRIDPLKLVTIITGVLSDQVLRKHIAHLQEALKKAYNHRKAVIETQLDNCQRIDKPGFVAKRIPTQQEWKSQQPDRYAGMGSTAPQAQQDQSSCNVM